MLIIDESLVAEYLTGWESETGRSERKEQNPRPDRQPCAERYSHTNWTPQRRSIPICPRQARSAAALTLGISPSRTIREPFRTFLGDQPEGIAAAGRREYLGVGLIGIGDKAAVRRIAHKRGLVPAASRSDETDNNKRASQAWRQNGDGPATSSIHCEAQKVS